MDARPLAPPAPGVPEAPGYARRAARAGRLSFSTKLFQGLGALPDALKSFAFNTFLLLYYDQVLGLPASWASAALAAAVAVDAVTDPVVGSWSDGLTSRLGRRHPLMYASVLPLGGSLYFLFSPPDGLEGVGLLAWLAAFAVSARVAMTLFQVPWSALFVELTDDYVERSEVVTYRWALAILGVAGFTVISWGLIFAGTEDRPGQLDPDAYARFAVVLALSVSGFALASSLLTQREARYLLQPTAPVRFGARRVLGDLRATLGNANFLRLFTGLLFTAVLTGTVEAMTLYLGTYFWGLTPQDLRWFALAAFGALAALLVLPWLNRRYDKRGLLVATMTLSILNAYVLVSLRFLGVLPENGEPWLVRILVANEVLRAFLVVIVGTMFVSMTADTADEQDLATGRRQEGVFSAAVSFSNKAISGFGILIAGLLLDFVVRFPDGAEPGSVPGGALVRLGVVMGYVVPSLYFLPLLVLARYDLDRAGHARITQALRARRAAPSPHIGDRHAVP